MPTPEQYTSYFIKKIKELEDRIKELEDQAHYKSMKEAVAEHSAIVQKRYSDSVLEEKRTLGALAWGVIRKGS